MARKEHSENGITIEDVAALAGVSRASVGRVIGNYGSVSEKTRQKVLEAVQQLNYRPNLIARGLRNNETKTIAVVLGSIRNTYCNALVYAVEKEASKHGYNVMICDTHEDEETELQHLQNLYSRKVDGIILLSAFKADREIPEEYKHLYLSDVPTVFADRRIQGIQRDTIQSNNMESSYQATKYLLELGHRKIGVIATADFSTISDRLSGFKKALLEFSVAYDPTLIVKTDTFGKQSGKDAAEYLLQKHPDMTAIYILNNSLSSGTLLALKKADLHIPDDISLLVWDDEEINELFDITTIVQPIDKIGKAVMQRLLSLMGSQANVDNYIYEEMATTMVIRKSCAAPHQR